VEKPFQKIQREGERYMFVCSRLLNMEKICLKKLQRVKNWSGKTTERADENTKKERGFVR
jgi:hypothetical protein